MNTFKKIAQDLMGNGYQYEFDSYCNYSSLSGIVEWGIKLIIE